jgi:hypothetical protein
VSVRDDCHFTPTVLWGQSILEHNWNWLEAPFLRLV